MRTLNVLSPRLHHRLGRLMMATSLVLMSLALAPAAQASDISRSQQQRALLGVAADEATIRQIIASGADSGSEKWGFVITTDEMASVEARMQRAQRIEERVATLVRTLPTYGGMYYEQHGSRLVVQLTTADPTLETTVDNLMPDGTELEFRPVDETYASLEKATRAVFDVWPSLTALPAPYHASLDTPANLVRVGVDAKFLIEAEALQPALEKELGVTVEIEVGQPPEAHACSTRDNCTNPIRSAVRVRKGSTTGTVCTMGFQVSKNGDEQFLTAAHCALDGSNNWYHQGYGFLGSEVQSLWSSGYDAVRIGFPDAQATAWMYRDGYVVGWSWPTVGDVVIQNQAMSDTIYFTEITDDWHCWTYLGQTLCGARMQGVGGQRGDSGAPLYRFFTSQLYAVGINFGGCGGGCMTRVGDVLSRMGVTLVVGS